MHARLAGKRFTRAAIFRVKLEEDVLTAERNDSRIRINFLIHLFAPAAPVGKDINDHQLIASACQLGRFAWVSVPEDGAARFGPLACGWPGWRGGVRVGIGGLQG